ncbi:ATP-binding protein [Porticoccus sp. W117]|uniref:ATP-binding protein n=1 Tax=Porticoccus sp. W117 TaxID=3054777 RepID=UPI00259674EF|nr:ATP-binding protein [Porticoccus sp. W117]MDM3869747.1 ATP-binding protein [Porticoccus sp. W117]
MSKLRGPRLSTKLILLGLVLLVIPYLGTQTLRAMKNFLVGGQQQAQLMTAQGIATLLYGRDELFNDTPPTLEGYATLPIYPLQSDIRLDADDDEWSTHGLTLKSEPYSNFHLVLGERDGNLYGLLEANDSTSVNRDPSYNRLNHADHVRLYFRDREGVEQRAQIVWEGNGKTTTYFMDNQWVNATDRGLPDYRIQGFIRRGDNDYRLEFRIPLNMISDGHLGVAVADAWEVEGRKEINTLSGTFDTIDGNPYSPMVLRSAQLQTILDSIAQTSSRIWILDSELRVRANSGELADDNPYMTTDDLPISAGNLWDSIISRATDRLIGIPRGDIEDYDPSLTSSRSDNILVDALDNRATTHNRDSLDEKTRIISAASPIRSEDNQVIGVVLLEQSTHQVLQQQSKSLERVTERTLLSLIAIVVAMLLFAARLAWRIRRLGRETNTSIDDYGRLQGISISKDLRAGDEIGDLARNINLALEKLNQHQGFLANIPRTLRHEINNPLNTISTSLDNLEREQLTDKDSTYLDSARRGLMRISVLIGKLADAANLEEALNAEDIFEFDLAAMLSAYVENQQKLSPDHKLLLNMDSDSVPFQGSDMHIEQLLDKLLDNARDFSEKDAPITINLFVNRELCELQVINQGPAIDEKQIPNLFQMMHSKRRDKTPGHFGLGLYVARVIAEHHGGSIKAFNLEDGSGPCFSVRLPLG